MYDGSFLSSLAGWAQKFKCLQLSDLVSITNMDPLDFKSYDSYFFFFFFHIFSTVYFITFTTFRDMVLKPEPENESYILLTSTEHIRLKTRFLVFPNNFRMEF